MNPFVCVEFTAKDVVKAVKRKDVVVVIDVLRCCSTIITALANGVEGVLPTRTVKEARALHEVFPEFLLAGERRGLKPRGFNLGNSPYEFSPEAIKGKRVIMTTTSGTKAIALSKNARWVLIGAFLNAEAVAKAALTIAERETTGISLLLFGRSGRFSLEDFICAGLIVENLLTNKVQLDDAALASLLAFQQSRQSLYTILQNGRHAQYLRTIGFEDDVKFCSKINVFKIVPFLSNGMVVPLPRSLKT